jgi:hypothetical protein
MCVQPRTTAPVGVRRFHTSVITQAYSPQTWLLDLLRGINMGKYKEKFRTIIVLFFTWVMLLAGFLVYEQYYVKGQEEYFRERGFRVLGTLESDLNSILEQSSDSIRSALKLLDPEKPPAKTREAARIYFNTHLPKAAAYREAQSVPNPALCDQSTLEWIPRPGLTLHIHCHVATAAPQLHPDAANAKAATETAAAQTKAVATPSSSASTADEASQHLAHPDLSPLVVLKLETWVRNSFENVDYNYFDHILIVDSSGNALFQMGATGLNVRQFEQFAPPPSQQSDFPSLVASEHAVSAPDPDHDTKRKHLPDNDSDDFTHLSLATNMGTLFLDGEQYLIFTQPITHLVDIDLRDTQHHPMSLVLCGLLRTTRFKTESHRLSYQSLIWAALLFVTVFSLSWPLFKLQYMNNKERFKPQHGWYLALAVLSATCSLTLVLLHASYTSQTTNVTDDALQTLATRMKANITNEMDLALYQLNALREEAMLSVKRQRVQVPLNTLGSRDYIATKQICRTVNYLSPSELALDLNDTSTCKLPARSGTPPRPTPLTYPFFDFALWADCDGYQLAKFTVRPAATPPTPLIQFAFFQRPVSSATIAMERFMQQSPSPPETRQGPPGCYTRKEALNIWDSEQAHVEELISTNTGDILVILSTPFTDDNTPGDETIAMQALAFKPMSLIDPVLPPHYSFAVIDHRCRVLFHANSTHNLRENFCDASKDTTELLPWLKTGGDQHLDISYEGRTARAYLTQLPIRRLSTEGHPDEKMFLIVFREPGVDATKSVAVMLACAIPLGVYIALTSVAGFIYLGGRKAFQKNYPPTCVWPDVHKAATYVQILIVNCAMLLLYRYSYAHLYRVRLLFLTMAVAFFAVLFTLSKLNAAYRLFGRIRQRYVLKAITGAFALLAAVAFGINFVKCIYLLHVSKSSVQALEMSNEYQSLIFYGVITICGLIGLFLLEGRSYLREWSALGRFGGDAVWRGSLQRIAEAHFRTAYILACMSLMFAVAIVPAVGFFKFAYDAVMEVSLKHDEVTLSERLEQRKDRVLEYYSDLSGVRAPYSTARVRLEGIGADAWKGVPDNPDFSGTEAGRLDRTGAGQLDRYDTGMFTVRCAPSTERCVPPSAPSPGTIDNSSGRSNDWIEQYIGEALRLQRNEFGLEIGKLVATSVEDQKGRWETNWEQLDSYRWLLRWNQQSPFPFFTISASYAPWAGLNAVSYVGLALIMVSLFFWLRTIIRKLFLAGGEAPISPRSVYWAVIKDVECDSLVLGRAQSGKTGRLLDIKPVEDVDYRDLRAELSEMPSGSTPGNIVGAEGRLDLNLSADLQSTASESQQNAPGRTVLVVMDHFEFNLKDPQCNRERLKRLEGLLRRPNVKRVIVSTVDPLYFFADEGSEVLSDDKDKSSSGPLFDRWVHALSDFQKVSLKDTSKQAFQFEFRQFLARHKETAFHSDERQGNMLLAVRPPWEQFALWIYLECRCTKFLRAVGMQLLRQYKDTLPPSREWLISNISSAAGAHYHVIWSDLTQKERLVLYQLALDGWANPHPENARAIEELERKGLISKRVMYRVMSESFCRFVKSTEHAGEIAELEREAGRSAWQALKLVLIAGAIGTFVWLLYAQADLFRIGLGYVAGIGALLTAAVNFFAGGKRASPGTLIPPQAQP